MRRDLREPLDGRARDRRGFKHGHRQRSRRIIDGINIIPARDRFKVFIIDEVHQLSKPAFNALLKTLEEPPRNVVFIMATTELHKVPETILSRTPGVRVSNHTASKDLRSPKADRRGGKDKRR